MYSEHNRVDFAKRGIIITIGNFNYKIKINKNYNYKLLRRGITYFYEASREF